MDPLDDLPRLLDSGGPVDAVRLARRACRAGHLSALRLLLARALVDAAGPSGGATYLQLAAGAGHLALVRLLLTAGADVGAPDADGWTALTHADAGEHEHVVVALLEAGSDPRSRSRHGLSPLARAVLAEPVDVDRVQDVLGRWPWLLEVRDGSGSTPLYAAAYRADDTPGRLAALEVLLEAGADVEARCSDTRDTPAFETLRQGSRSPGALRLLLAAGARTDVRAAGGRTLLHQAAAWGAAADVRLLVDAGADLRATDGRGRTPLDEARELGDDAVVRLLEGLSGR